MDTLQLVNNIALTIIIGMYLMAFCLLIIRARGEEWRKNEILATKMTDRIFDKLSGIIKETVREIKEEVPNKNSYKNQIEVKQVPEESKEEAEIRELLRKEWKE